MPYPVGPAAAGSTPNTRIKASSRFTRNSLRPPGKLRPQFLLAARRFGGAQFYSRNLVPFQLFGPNAQLALAHLVRENYLLILGRRSWNGTSRRIRSEKWR